MRLQLGHSTRAEPDPESAVEKDAHIDRRRVHGKSAHFILDEDESYIVFFTQGFQHRHSRSRIGLDSDMAWDHDEKQCPLAAIDRRLEDVHRFWHQAERAYFEPDEFRVAIQAAIQTARQVSFVLQKNKA